MKNLLQRFKGRSTQQADSPSSHATSSTAGAGRPTPSGRSGTAPDNKNHQDDGQLTIGINTRIWPAFDPGDDAQLLSAAGPLLLDFTGNRASQWARGVNVDSAVGRPLFGRDNPEGFGPDQIPPLLFDLAQRRVVKATEIGRAQYAVISHVWGNVTEIDGSEYGVSWKIPIQSEAKLSQILEAARVITGERYIWIDVLCMDQRQQNEHEIARMKEYFGNATGCFVWLDNAFDGPSWMETLAAVKEVNKFFNLDEFGSPNRSVLDKITRGESFFDLSMNGDEVVKWIKELFKIEKAPWFKRVWTLQEGVIPDKLYFCTPERYMTGGANIFMVIGVCETLAKVLLDAGSRLGVVVTNQLQKSEIYKMLKLRALYRKREISYWHVAQAVRSRECKLEQDKLFGVCGLIQGTVPIVDYKRSIGSLYQDLFRACLDAGDFKPCLFLGGKELLPDKDISMGYIPPTPADRSESHQLALTGNGLQMNGVGTAHVERAHCIVGWGPLQAWNAKFPQLMDMTRDDQRDIATAFGLSPELHKSSPLYPASLAAIASLSMVDDNRHVKEFHPGFQEMYDRNVPKGFVVWTKVLFLMQERADAALILLWTSGNSPQLAVVTEPVEGNVLAVMPSSYLNSPGPSCLICKVLPNGNLKKIGVGLGKRVKATGVGSYLLVT